MTGFCVPELNFSIAARFLSGACTPDLLALPVRL